MTAKSNSVKAKIDGKGKTIQERYYDSHGKAYLDIDSDGTVDTIYPNSIDENVVLKSEEVKIRKQSSSFKMYPSVSTSNSMTWKYMYTDYDEILTDNKLYGYIDANITPSSNPDISVSNDYQLATFGSLSKGKTLTIKKSEKAYKNSPASTISLTSQYFYGYQSSLNLSYTVSAADNVITLLIDDYNKQGLKYINLNGVVGDFETQNEYSGLNESKLGFNSNTSISKMVNDETIYSKMDTIITLDKLDIEYSSFVSNEYQHNFLEKLQTSDNIKIEGAKYG